MNSSRVCPRTIGCALRTTSLCWSTPSSGWATSWAASSGVSPQTSKTHCWCSLECYTCHPHFQSKKGKHITVNQRNCSLWERNFAESCFPLWDWKWGRPVRKTSSMWLISLGRRPTVLLSHGAYFLGGVLTLIFPNFTLLLFFRCNFLSNFYLTTPAGFWWAVLITLSPIFPTS